MRNWSVKKLFKSKVTGNIVILLASIVLVYVLVSFYFTKHFFFNTVINGVDVSLKAYDDVDGVIRSYIKGYKLQLIERNADIEEISGNDIGIQYNEKNSIFRIYPMQNSLKWISSLLVKDQKYYVESLYIYNEDSLENKINQLNCLNKDSIESQNVSFKYSNGSYEVIGEVYGNKINKENLEEAIKLSILKGKTKLDLSENLCYEDPKYTLNSEKTHETKNLLNKYVSTKITYVFRNKKEVLDGDRINEWLSVNENLEAVVDEKAVKKYVQGLGKKYDTDGVTRNFKASIGKTVEVRGGFYGWKINLADETKALLENIKHGKVLEKEPIYAQKAFSMDEDEIGSTYVEINITRQYLWFYKDGKIVTQGDVVTGDPSRGFSTMVGTYMLNYKQKESTLRGPNYEAKVTYWMPFNGNIGLHDASWRYSFGGNIYKTDGTHGCVNAPLYLAKTIFNHIEDGTPFICYEE